MTHQIICTIEPASDKNFALINADSSFYEILWFVNHYDYFVMFDKPSDSDYNGDKRYGKIGEGIAEIKPKTAQKILDAIKSGKKIETKYYSDIEDEDELAFALVYNSYIHSIEYECLLLVFNDEKVDTIEKLEDALFFRDDRLFVIPADFHS